VSRERTFNTTPAEEPPLKSAGPARDLGHDGKDQEKKIATENTERKRKNSKKEQREDRERTFTTTPAEEHCGAGGHDGKKIRLPRLRTPRNDRRNQHFHYSDYSIRRIQCHPLVIQKKPVHEI
jgi:hypothetical protein